MGTTGNALSSRYSSPSLDVSGVKAQRLLAHDTKTITATFVGVQRAQSAHVHFAFIAIVGPNPYERAV